MTWRIIARQDWSRTVDARSSKLLLGLLVVVVLLAAYIYPMVGPEPITTARFPGFAHGALTTLIPFVGILLGYDAVVSERASGAILLSLSLPYSRGDLVLGKYVSRTGLVVGAILVSMLGAGFLVVYPFGELAVVPFVAFVVLTVVFGAIWCGLGIAISLAVATKRRALVAGFVLLVPFAIAWDTLVGAVRLGLNAAGVVDGDLPGPVQFLVGLEPGHVFERLTVGFIQPGGSIDGPWYLNEWVALALFALWAVGPLGLAYRRFAGRDLS